MRAEEIRQQNEKFYYCKDYIWSLNNVKKLAPCTLVAIMGVISYRINQIFLKRKFFLQAAGQELGNEDVMHWVEARVQENCLNATALFIIAINLIIFVIAAVCSLGLIKSYNLYKTHWPRGMVVGLYLLEIVIFFISYSRFHISPLLVGIVAEIVWTIAYSRLLISLETRPQEGGGLGFLLKLLDVAGIIIKRL